MATPLILPQADVQRLRVAIEHRLAFKSDYADVTGPQGPIGGPFGNLDGGHADTIYGGVSPIDGGNALSF